MTSVDFYRSDYRLPEPATYVIIGARYNDKWIFVKSRKRGGFELPAGHIASDEASDYAAGRELSEETGAEKFIIECLNCYSVKEENSTMWGRLYLAEVIELGEIKDRDEVEEILLSATIPEISRYPIVQTAIFNRLEESL